MKLANVRWVPALFTLALATVVAPYAHAGCGEYHPASFAAGPQRLGSPLLHTALGTDVAGAAAYLDEYGQPTIVGTWKEHWISEGTQGIPDGTQIDAGYAQWHSDHTEMNISGLRAPLTGNVCMGEWIKVGDREYRMNHFGISYDPTGQKLVGIAHIQQWLTLDQDGMATVGKFTIDQYDEQNNLLAHVQGRILGSRVTINTGFQKLE